LLPLFYAVMTFLYKRIGAEYLENHNVRACVRVARVARVARCPSTPLKIIIT